MHVAPLSSSPHKNEAEAEEGSLRVVASVTTNLGRCCYRSHRCRSVPLLSVPRAFLFLLLLILVVFLVDNKDDQGKTYSYSTCVTLPFVSAAAAAVAAAAASPSTNHRRQQQRQHFNSVGTVVSATTATTCTSIKRKREHSIQSSLASASCCFLLLHHQKSDYSSLLPRRRRRLQQQQVQSAPMTAATTSTTSTTTPTTTFTLATTGEDTSSNSNTVASMEAPTTSSSTTSTSKEEKGTIMMSNWRTIRKDQLPQQQQQQQQQLRLEKASDGGEETADANTAANAATDASLLLQERAVWSEAAYQDALELYQQLISCSDSYMAGHVATALNTLDHAYRLYGPDSVLCSFNGGKDAVVILHLVRAAHAHYYQTQQQQHSQQQNQHTIHRPRVIYFDHADEFPQVLQFVQDSVTKYDLDMIAFEQGIKFSQGLELLVHNNNIMSSCTVSSTAASTTRPTMSYPMAFVLGTRDTDPNAGQQGHFAPSSHYMPPFLRVNPILSWSYGHVWHFLRLFHLPYCSLYDEGYTSLGTVKDTKPCPALQVAGTKNAHGLPKYWPAYMLRDWDQERAGRISASSTSGAAHTKQQQDNKDKKKKSADKKNALHQQSQSPPQPQGQDEVGSVSGGLLSRADSSLTNFSAVSTVRGAPTDVVVTPQVNGVTGERHHQELAADKDAPLMTNSDVSVVSYTSDSQKTVGVLIIGDEILKGYTADVNIQAAAKALREENVYLKKVVVVSDDLQDIVDEIERMQNEVDVIITSGGVGPTHDDVTIKSVAAALRCDMILHEEMAQLLRDKMHTGKEKELTPAQVKMATLPSSSKLRYLSKNPKDWPVLQCRNIFILPGVPEFFVSKIQNVASYLSCQLERGKAYKVVLSVDENSIVPILNRVVENHPHVTFGSYPFVSHPEYKTVITVEGKLVPAAGQQQQQQQQQQQEMQDLLEQVGSDAEEDNRLNNSSTNNNGAVADAGGAASKKNSPLRVRNSALFEKCQWDNTISKEQMDEYVQLALDELIHSLPERSVLRVDNEDMTLFS